MKNIDAQIAIQNAIDEAEILYIVAIKGENSHLVVVCEDKTRDVVDEISTAICNQLAHELDNDDSPPILCSFLDKVEESEMCDCPDCTKLRIESELNEQKN